MNTKSTQTNYSERSLNKDSNNLLINQISNLNIERMRTNSRLFELFVKRNEGFIHNLAKKFNPISYDDYMDYFQEGLIGLKKAVDSFNPAKKVSLSTYAWKCVYNNILQYINSEKKKTDKNVSIENFLRQYDNTGSAEYNEITFKNPLNDDNFESHIINDLAMEDWFNELEDLHKKIFRLRVIEKRKHKEVYEELNLNKHTYKYIWHYHVSPKVKQLQMDLMQS